MNHFDLWDEMPSKAFYDLDLPANGNISQQVTSRTEAAHHLQAERYRNNPILQNNAGLSGAMLNTIATANSADREC